MQTEAIKINGTTTTPPRPPDLVLLNLADVDEHPKNPRKTFRAREELAESIKTHGVLEPVLCRAKKGGRYEIIFGARRYRASKLAKVTTVPAFVRPIEDREAEEMMLVENGQRQDLHELEEAEGYERLQKVHGMTVEDIAAKTGKTRATVYARMKLCALGEKARKAFYDGELNATTALAIARIPDEKLQAEALKAVRDYNGDPLSTRRALEVVQNKFMLRLVDAPFDRASTTLVAAAGACTTCPKRTGNQKELFADVKSSDMCTDPKCYESKVDAEWERRVKEAPEKGVEVLSAKETKKLFPFGNHLTHNSAYQDLDAMAWDGQKQTTVRKKLGKELPPITIVRDPDGNIHELVKASTVESRSRNPSSPAAKKKASAERDASNKAKAKEALEQRCNELAIHALAEKAEKKTPGADFFRALVLYVAEPLDASTLWEVMRPRMLSTEADEKKAAGDYHYANKVLARAIEKLSEPKLRGLLVELVSREEAERGRADRTAFDRLCDFYKVDPKKFAAEAKASVGAGAKS